MKKILLSFLILGIVSISSPGFSALQTYEFGYQGSDPFDSNDWTPMFGGWDSTVFDYTGYPTTTGGIAASKVGILPDLVSAGIYISTNFYFSPVNGNYAGIFLGAGQATSPSSSFSDWVTVGVSIDASDSIYLQTNFFGAQEQISLDKIYLGELLQLHVTVDPLFNDLYWGVYIDYVEVDSGVRSSALLSGLMGGVGVFAENEGAIFDAFYVEGDDGSPVPVPAAIWLFASGLLGLVGLKRRQK